LNQLIESFE